MRVHCVNLIINKISFTMIVSLKWQNLHCLLLRIQIC